MNALRRLSLLLASVVILSAPGSGPAEASPSPSEIASTWTGLEFNAHAGGSRLFTLELARAAPGTGGPVRGRGAEAVAVFGGTWTSRPLARDRKGRQAPPIVETVVAEYFADSGILRATRKPSQGGGGVEVLIVFDADVRRLAGVFIGGAKDRTPFTAVRGAAPGEELLGVTGLAREQWAPEAGADAPDPANWREAYVAALAEGDYGRARALLAHQGRPAAAGAGASAAAARDPAAEIAALQVDLQEAAGRGDVEAIKRLQQRMRELRTLAADRRRAGAAPQSSASGCPEHLVAWAAQLDANGGSVAHFEGDNHLANLFRPRLFTPFFGKPFAALSPSERAGIAGELQRGCLGNGTPLGGGSAIGAMISAFQDAPGYNAAQAGLGGLALEIIADWNLRSVRALGGEEDAGRVEDFENKSRWLIASLFALERKETRLQLAALKLRNHGRRLLAETGALARAAVAGDADALTNLVALPRRADALAIVGPDRARFDEAHARALAEAAASFLGRARAQALAAPPGVEQLLRSRLWLESEGEAFLALRLLGHPPAQEFHRDFVAARAASYAAERARMAREIAALDSQDALDRYPAAFLLPTDFEQAPAWRELETLRRERGAVFAKKEFLARTGDGPFGPDHPGARYLNALWRNDQPAIEEMDRRHREAYLGSLAMLEEVDHAPDLLERFSGGAYSADKYRRMRRALVEESSLANLLLVHFAFEFEHAYPACMDPRPEEFRVHVRNESIVRNGLGLMVGTLPAGTTTIVHRVNQRHADAVRDLGIADPGRGVVFEALFGGHRSPAGFARAGEGLALAMRRHPCDDEVIRRIEAALLARSSAFAARKREIRARILGDG